MRRSVTIGLMPPVQVDPTKIIECQNAQSFYSWLSKHHDTEQEVWIKIYKLSSGLPSITPKEAIDAVLCWGWIDGVRKSFDEKSYLQRYTPRRKKSIWSAINVANVNRLVNEGRMTEHGLKAVGEAKADGRWDHAYGSGSDMEIPADLGAAIQANPDASRTVKRLSAQNRFALAFRMHNTKTEMGRKRKIEKFVEMLAKGDTIHPQR